MSRRLLMLVIILASTVTAAHAQVRFRIATGLSTDWITNDNPAVYRLTGTGDPLDSEAGFGGGFDGVQFGWGLKGFADLDKQKILRIPFGIDYFNYHGAQAILAPSYEITVTHTVNMFTPYAGFEWSFVEFPLAYARAYIGAETRLTYLPSNEVRYQEWYANGDTKDSTFSTKEAAARLGGMIRLGIEGEIYYPVFVNTSVAWGVMNLIGRDMRSTAEGGRGELLTASKLNESGEGLIYHLNFTFMVQIRI